MSSDAKPHSLFCFVLSAAPSESLFGDVAPDTSAARDTSLARTPAPGWWNPTISTACGVGCRAVTVQMAQKAPGRYESGSHMGSSGAAAAGLGRSAALHRPFEALRLAAEVAVAGARTRQLALSSTHHVAIARAAAGHAAACPNVDDAVARARARGHTTVTARECAVSRPRALKVAAAQAVDIAIARRRADALVSLAPALPVLTIRIDRTIVGASRDDPERQSEHQQSRANR